jgi:uncharacterized delta-60 repeat protein
VSPVLTAVALAVVCATVAAAAGAGSLDHSFSGDGKRLVRFSPYADNGYAVDVQGNGKIVLAGSSVRSGANNDWAISRLQPGGGLDNSFSSDGKRFLSFDSTSNEAAFDVGVQGNGRVVAVGPAGTAAGGLDFGIVRLRPGGSLDTTFSGDGRRTFGFGNGTRPDRALAMAIQADGRIVVAGESFDQGIDSSIGVARLKPSGALDHSFSDDGKRLVRFDPNSGGDSAQDLAIQPDGRIVIVGYSGVSSNQAIGIVRLLPSGRLDPSFSGDGRRLVRFQNGIYSDHGFGVARAPGGGIVVAGDTGSAGGVSFAVARLLSNGNLDHSFSGNGLRAVSFGPSSQGASGRAVVVRGDGRILLVGSSIPAPMQSDFGVAELLPNGDLDRSFAGNGKLSVAFGPSGSDNAYAVALAPNRRAVVAGSSSAPGDQDFAVARLLGGP